MIKISLKHFFHFSISYYDRKELRATFFQVIIYAVLELPTSRVHGYCRLPVLSVEYHDNTGEIRKTRTNQISLFM